MPNPDWERRILGGSCSSAPSHAWHVPLTHPPFGRRGIQILLGLLWLLDSALQSQPVMFIPEFTSDSMQIAAQGNPAVIAAPMFWAAGVVSRIPLLAGLGLVAVQLALALGLFWRRTAVLALAGSLVWSLLVWWLGEGFGGIFNGTAEPLMGFPGPIILYGLLTLLAWPACARESRSVAEDGPIGGLVARGLWLLLWASLAYFALTPANRAPNALAAMAEGMAEGEPSWLAALDHATAGALTGNGLLVSTVFAVLATSIAVGIFLPIPARGTVLVAAIALATVIWVIAQNFGAILTGQAADPNTGPLLILLAFAYWPRPRRSR